MTTAKTALIIGASRGLGLGLVQRLREDGWHVTATVRDLQKADALRSVSGVHIERLEMNSQEQLTELGQRLQGQTFDLLFVNAGIKSPAHQSTELATQAELGELFMTNAIAPIRLARLFAPQLRENTGVIAFMSSGLGRVTSPDSPELALYKASKAALNSMTNTLMTQLDMPALTFLSMAPGWVRTDMGGEDAPLDVETSTRGLIEQVNAYAGKGGHYFISYQGESLPW